MEINSRSAIDNVIPKEKWEFDGEVTNAFDDMLRRSIPQYEMMRQLVYEVGCEFVQTFSHIIDLGCSRGESIAPFMDKFGTQVHYIGVDTSGPMLAVCRDRFKRLIKDGIVTISNVDLRHDFPKYPASLTLAILTVQFIPIEYRLQLLDRIYQNLHPGGAFIMVEKVMGASAVIDRDFTNLYLRLKSINGYSQEQIDRKKMSLEGVLVPLPAGVNEDFLKRVGFKQIDCFWRWLNFAGWVAVK